MDSDVAHGKQVVTKAITLARQVSKSNLEGSIKVTAERSMDAIEATAECGQEVVRATVDLGQNALKQSTDAGRKMLGAVGRTLSSQQLGEVATLDVKSKKYMLKHMGTSQADRLTPRAMFALADEDGSGQINLEEVPRSLPRSVWIGPPKRPGPRRPTSPPPGHSSKTSTS